MSTPPPIRLAALSTPAKLLVTLFLALIGAGYLAGAAQVYSQHRDADGDHAFSLDDVRAVYHGIEKELAKEDAQSVLASQMLRQVRPGGEMREHLTDGGPAAVASLIGWLEAGGDEEGFDRAAGGAQTPKRVLERRCVECHNPDGENDEVRFAREYEGEAEYSLVAEWSRPIAPPPGLGGTVKIGPKSVRSLLSLSHTHFLTIPVFALIVGGFFLLTGLGQRTKLLLGPLPMAALAVDFVSWWAARPFEPFVYVIIAAGAVFGAAFGLQMLLVLGSLWFGKRPDLPGA